MRKSVDAPIVIERSFAKTDIDSLRSRFRENAFALVDPQHDQNDDERIGRILDNYFDHNVIGAPGDLSVAKRRYHKALNYAINSGTPYVHSRDPNAIDDKSPSISQEDETMVDRNYSARFTVSRTDEWKINPNTRVEHILGEADVAMSVRTSVQGDKLVTTISDLHYELDCHMSYTRHYRQPMAKRCVGPQYWLDENELRERLSRFNLLQFFKSDLKDAADLANRGIYTRFK